MNPSNKEYWSFLLAPDEHIDVRLFDFYDHVPRDLIANPIGRAAARRALNWTETPSQSCPQLLFLKRLEFLKCVEAIGCALVLPTLLKSESREVISRFTLMVSPFAREASFAAVRGEIVKTPLKILSSDMLAPVFLPKTIYGLGAATLLATIEGSTDAFSLKINAKLKGAGGQRFKIDSKVAHRVVQWCDSHYKSEASDVH